MAVRSGRVQPHHRVKVLRVQMANRVLIGHQQDRVRPHGLAMLLVLRLLVARGAEAERGG